MLTVVLAACGGDDADPGETASPSGAATTTAAAALDDCPDDPVGDATRLTVTATDDFRFEPDPLEVAAGEVLIDFDNPSLAQHSFVIEGTDIGVLAEPSADCAELVTLEAGTYTVFCDVVGHREAGMETTLTVS